MIVFCLLILGYFLFKALTKPKDVNWTGQTKELVVPPPRRITANIQIEKKALQTLEAAYNLHNTKSLTIAQNCLKILHPNLVWLNGYYQKYEDMYERSVKNAIEMYRERYYDKKLTDEIKTYVDAPDFYLGKISTWSEHCLETLMEALENFALAESTRIEKLKTEKAIMSNRKKALRQINEFVQEVSADYELNESALKNIDYCKSLF